MPKRPSPEQKTAIEKKLQPIVDEEEAIIEVLKRVTGGKHLTTCALQEGAFCDCDPHKSRNLVLESIAIDIVRKHMQSATLANQLLSCYLVYLPALEAAYLAGKMANDQITIKETLAKIDFDYCECGCKGYSMFVNNEHYWCFWHLKGPKEGLFSLYKNHGFISGVFIKDFTSLEQATEEVRNRVESQWPKKYV